MSFGCEIGALFETECMSSAKSASCASFVLGASRATARMPNFATLSILCARAASGHVATPPTSVMNSRRPMKGCHPDPSSPEGCGPTIAQFPKTKGKLSLGAHASGGFPSPCATVREMKEGPSRSAIRWASLAYAPGHRPQRVGEPPRRPATFPLIVEALARLRSTDGEACRLRRKRRSLFDGPARSNGR